MTAPATNTTTPEATVDAAPPAADADRLPELPAPDLPELGAGVAGSGSRGLRLLGGVSVELTVELGRVQLPLRELLGLTPGSVLELDRPVDAPVDVLVNGCVVARGEIVVLEGELGVRVTSLVER